jgi:hypothetical protein
MAEGRDLVKEALQDAKSLKEAAVEAARNQLVESLTPAVKELLNKSIKGVLNERGSKIVHGDDSQPTLNKNEKEQKQDYVAEEQTPELTLEDALQEFFPANGGVGAQNLGEETDMANMKESAESKKDKADVNEEVESTASEKVNEEYEISDNELKRVYEAALQTEVQVKKGFSALKEPFVELGGKTPDNAKTPPAPPTGKGGTKPWNDETPPHKKDWIPENVQKMLRAGLEENKALRESLRKAVAMVETLGKKLHEVNLFNAKVLHVNKILNGGGKLTKEQKTYVMESIDKARSIGEVKMVFETIVGTMKTTQTALTEGRVVRPPKADAQKARTSGTPDQKVLSESVDRSQSDDRYSRIRQLAGIVNGKK